MVEKDQQEKTKITANKVLFKTNYRKQFDILIKTNYQPGYMKTTIRIFCILFCASMCLPVNAQTKQAAIGTTVENISIDKVLSKTSALKDLHSLKGKVTILDFWATWCLPCIASMKHLENLKKDFGDRLQVIAISDESEEIVKEFLAKKEQTLLFALDSTKRLNNYFPHLSIPHTILIGEDLKILAITDPYNITKEVIEAALSGKPIALTEKRFEVFEQNKDYLNADTSVISRFQISEPIPSLPRRIQGWHDNPVFSGRRFTLINFTVEEMLNQTYPSNLKLTLFDTSAASVVPEGVFCSDIIVSKDRKDSLFTDFRKCITQYWGIKTRIDSIRQEVYLLKRVDNHIFNESRQKKARHVISDGHGYKADSSSIADFIADCLERYSGIPVIDQTHLPGHYDIDFRFDFQKNFPFVTEGQEFLDNLRKVGFTLEKTHAKAPALFIYK